jgi:hypothetical protein
VVAAILNGAQRLGQVNAAEQNALKVLQAQLDGNDALVTRFLNQAIGIAHRTTARLQAALEAAKETGNGPAIQKAAEALAQGRQAELNAIQAANQNLAAQASGFDAAGAAQTQLAASDAQRTKTRADDLAAAQATTARDEKRLTVIENQNFHFAKDRRAAIAAQRVVISQDRNAEQTIRDQIASDNQAAADKAKQAAADAAQFQENELRVAADAAGNTGKAEQRLIDFLKLRVSQAKAHTLERQSLEADLRGEQQKQAAAIQAVAQASTDLTNARLATQLARAQATPGTADDKRAFQAQINFNTSLIAGLRAEETSVKRTSAAYKEKEVAVQNLIQANIGLQQSIKGLNDQSSGFSLQDFFKAGQDQFNQFASNVSSSVTTSGGLRAALAGASLSLNPKMSEADREKLVEASKTNVLLQDILDVLQQNGQVPKQTTVSDTGWLSQFDHVTASDVKNARQIGRHVRTR